MIDILNTPAFGILLSIITFEIGILICKKVKISILNPLILSVIFCISFLLFFNIDIELYEKGGNIINFLLGPATILLAVPLYKQIELLKSNLVPILGGITVGAITSIVSVWGLSMLFGVDKTLFLSMLPKSVTTPIGIEVSSQIGGLPSITVLAIIVTGNVGVILSKFILKIFSVNDEVAVGVAYGTSTHALGTTKAMEIGEKQGAMSSLSIGITGLITVFVAPILIRLLNI